MEASAKGKSYRDLEVWQESMNLVDEVYRATEGFPKNQQFSLVQQIQRSVISVPSNIAEGHGRKKHGEFMYHLRVSRGSLYELETQLIASRRLAFMGDEQFKIVSDRIQLVGRLLNGLLRFLERTPC